jgi:hypothetical protein
MGTIISEKTISNLACCILIEAKDVKTGCMSAGGRRTEDALLWRNWMPGPPRPRAASDRSRSEHAFRTFGTRSAFPSVSRRFNRSALSLSLSLMIQNLTAPFHGQVLDFVTADFNAVRFQCTCYLKK